MPRRASSPASRAASRRIDEPGRDDVGAQLARAAPRCPAGSPRAARAAPRTAASTRRGRCRRRRCAAARVLTAPSACAAPPRAGALRRCAAARARAGRGRRAFGTITLASSSPPTTMFWSCAGTRSAVIAVCRQPSTATASDDAGDRAAAAEDRDAAEQDDRDDEAAPSRRRSRSAPRRSGASRARPRSPLSVPERTNSQNLIRLTRMPAKNAASWPAPIAKIARPSGVACRTTPKTIASTPKNAIEYGMCVPGSGHADVRQAGREAADRVRRQDALRDAAVERQRPDRDRQRGQARAA